MRHCGRFILWTIYDNNNINNNNNNIIVHVLYSFSYFFFFLLIPNIHIVYTCIHVIVVSQSINGSFLLHVRTSWNLHSPQTASQALTGSFHF